jgi:type VI protein secretion system component VasK
MGDEARGDDREVDHVQRLLAPFWAIVKLLVWLGICISVCITAALLVLHGRVDLGPLGDFNPWTLILGGSVITPAVALAGRSIRRRRIRAYLKGDADVGRSDPSPSADDLRRDVPRQRADQTDTKASGIARNGKRQRTAVRL